MMAGNMSAAEAELRQRGEPHGLSVAAVRMADKLGMDLRKYSRYQSARTVYDAQRIDRELRAEDEAQAEAARQVAIEAARRAL